MTITHITPPDVLELPGVSPVIVTTGRRHVYVSGQAPVTPDGALIGEGDLGAQAAAAIENLLRCLKAADATLADVVRLTLYVVDYGPESLDAIYGAAFAVMGDELAPTTSTLVGVAALFLPGQLFEIDAVAVLD